MSILLKPRFPICDRPFTLFHYTDGMNADYVVMDAEQTPVALVGSFGDGEEQPPDDIALGHGYLFAAAPEMRTAATRLLELLALHSNHLPNVPDMVKAATDLLFAVAKANGHDEHMLIEERVDAERD